jgi:2-polyprenyl-3-methyl-5-hydroxy-6-metoxy-1,4-benzoquinol methylase
VSLRPGRLVPLADTRISWNRVDAGPGSFSSPALTMSRPCPICGSLKRGQPFLEFADYQFFSDDLINPKRTDVRNVVCGQCLAAYLDPVYTEAGFSILFAQAGRSYGAADQTNIGGQARWIDGHGLLGSGVTVLDIGCYEGEFLASLPDAIKLMGVDIDRVAVARARGRLGDRAQLVTSDLEHFVPTAPPDVITMFHVLEHLARPVDVLTRLRAAAHEGTRLVVEVPVVEGPPTNDLVGFFSVQHTVHFSEHSLAQCLGRAGWEVVDRVSAVKYNGLRVLCRPRETVSMVSGDPYDLLRIREALISWQRAVVAVSKRLLASVGDVERCLIWGAGMHLEHLYAVTPFFQSRPDREYLIVDSDPLKQGRSWRGIDVIPPDIVAGSDCQDLPLLVASYGDQPAIAKAARERGVPEGYIVMLYDTVNSY